MTPSPLSSENTRIHVLPEAMANQIAAGEVVERPASVVKELLENSIDAGATAIRIEIEGAGKKLIRVSDNGLGMAPEDVPLAFQRHATSKVVRVEDLGSIRTLGFRGEALPSIASIARVRLTSSADTTSAGAEISIDGGERKAVREVAAPRGTTVEVRQIFFNTPARRKFLKGDSTEASHITQVVTQQALAHPGIHFTLVHNGRQVIDTLPAEQPLYRIAELFGTELARELLEVDEQQGGYRLSGYLSNPVFTRSNRSAQYFFINGRFIRDKVILHATQLGYSHLLPRDQHPVLFLHLFMDPELLDVNVHPAKAEVRFAYQQEVHRVIAEGVRKALTRNEPGGLAPAEAEALPREEEAPGPSRPQGSSPSHGPGTAAAGKVHSQPPETRPVYSRDQQAGLSRALEQFYKTREEPSAGEGKRTPAPAQIEIFDRPLSPLSSLIYSDFKPLGQLRNSFIIMQGEKGILVVDQHIAHERVLYERFRKEAKSRKVEVQQLLFPLAVEFSAGEAQLLKAHLDRLNPLGLELEAFGNNGFLLRAVPAILKNGDHETLLRDIVEALPRSDNPQALDEKYEEIVTMMSCRNAIKVNQPLEPDQIGKLIFDLEQTEMPYTCPHGRPIALLIGMEDLLKKFLRK